MQGTEWIRKQEGRIWEETEIPSVASKGSWKGRREFGKRRDTQHNILLRCYIIINRPTVPQKNNKQRQTNTPTHIEYMYVFISKNFYTRYF